MSEDLPSHSDLPALQVIQNEEFVALEAYYHISGGSCKNPIAETSYDATKNTQMEFSTCQPPPGFLYDIDDNQLIAFDSYWDASKNLGQVKLAEDHSQDTYFRKAELPIRDPLAFRRKTIGPRATVEGFHRNVGRHGGNKASQTKGRFLAATQHLRVGETIAMDTSDLVSVNEAALYKYPPTLSPASNSPAAESRTPQPILWKCCQHMVRKATQDISDGNALLVHSSIIPMLCSLLLNYGDMNLIARGPRNIVEATQKEFASLSGMAAFEFGDDTTNTLSLRSQQIVHCVLNDYCRHEFLTSEVRSDSKSYSTETPSGISPQEEHLIALAKLTIRCIPATLIRVETTQKGKTFAFFSRLGLHQPLEMAKFISAIKSNSMNVQCPDMPNRTALFPFLRFAEHECRPNAVVNFIDSPASHRYGVSGLYNYNSAKEAEVDDPKTKKTNKISVAKKVGTCALSSIAVGFEVTEHAWRPALAVLTAIRDIQPGEAISIAYLPTAYVPCPVRKAQLLLQYNFSCACRWCQREPDLARGFRCQHCPPNMGVVCPTGDGSKLTEWCCMHCGSRPTVEEVNCMQDHEIALQATKADKHAGLAKLLSDPYVHYTHSLVFKKIDEWSEKAWVTQDATMCTEYIDVMKKCVSRVLDEGDPSKAQLFEFSGQVQHALGNAHSARYEYFLAYQHRLKCGQRFTHWCRLTGYMANVKSLVDLLDSK